MFDAVIFVDTASIFITELTKVMFSEIALCAMYPRGALPCALKLREDTTTSLSCVRGQILLGTLIEHVVTRKKGTPPPSTSLLTQRPVLGAGGSTECILKVALTVMSVQCRFPIQGPGPTPLLFLQPLWWSNRRLLINRKPRFGGPATCRSGRGESGASTQGAWCPGRARLRHSPSLREREGE